MNDFTRGLMGNYCRYAKTMCGYCNNLGHCELSGYCVHKKMPYETANAYQVSVEELPNEIIINGIKYIREVKEKHNQNEAICPVCDYRISQCQCLFTGSCHPDRHKQEEVVYYHLYLLSDEQLKHIIEFQKYHRTSYGDEERTVLLAKLEKMHKEINE